MGAAGTPAPKGGRCGGRDGRGLELRIGGPATAEGICLGCCFPASPPPTLLFIWTWEKAVGECRSRFFGLFFIFFVRRSSWGGGQTMLADFDAYVHFAFLRSRARGVDGSTLFGIL